MSGNGGLRPSNTSILTRSNFTTTNLRLAESATVRQVCFEHSGKRGHITSSMTIRCSSRRF